VKKTAGIMFDKHPCLSKPTGKDAGRTARFKYTLINMKISYYRHRPHFQPPGATLFVTFRLHGSLPKHVVEQLQDEYNSLNQIKMQYTLEGKQSKEYQNYYTQQKQLIGRYDTHLHQSTTGPHYLKEEKIALLVCSTMEFWDQKRYDVLAYCVMSNHVHNVFTPLEKNDGDFHSLERIMHSIKSYTAGEANKLLNRKGKPFWAHESFDHYSRNAEETERIVSYVLYNPVKVGLVDSWKEWPWSYCKYL
jgi:REP element-mobilizing transposase RayT